MRITVDKACSCQKMYKRPDINVELDADKVAKPDAFCQTCRQSFRHGLVTGLLEVDIFEDEHPHEIQFEVKTPTVVSLSNYRDIRGPTGRGYDDDYQIWFHARQTRNGWKRITSGEHYITGRAVYYETDDGEHAVPRWQRIVKKIIQSWEEVLDRRPDLIDPPSLQQSLAAKRETRNKAILERVIKERDAAAEELARLEIHVAKARVGEHYDQLD